MKKGEQRGTNGEKRNRTEPNLDGLFLLSAGPAKGWKNWKNEKSEKSWKGEQMWTKMKKREQWWNKTEKL